MVHVNSYPDTFWPTSHVVCLPASSLSAGPPPGPLCVPRLQPFPPLAAGLAMVLACSSHVTRLVRPPNSPKTCQHHCISQRGTEVQKDSHVPTGTEQEPRCGWHPSPTRSPGLAFPHSLPVHLLPQWLVSCLFPKAVGSARHHTCGPGGTTLRQ